MIRAVMAMGGGVLYRVTYEDGDTEDLDEDELQEIALPVAAEPAQTPSKGIRNGSSTAPAAPVQVSGSCQGGGGVETEFVVGMRVKVDWNGGMHDATITAASECGKFFNVSYGRGEAEENVDIERLVYYANSK